MRPCRLLTCSIFLGLLAGCQTMTPQERRAADEQTCASYGFRPNTDAMAQCLLDLELDRRANMRSLRDSNSFRWGSAVYVDRRVVQHRR